MQRWRIGSSYLPHLGFAPGWIFYGARIWHESLIDPNDFLFRIEYNGIRTRSGEKLVNNIPLPNRHHHSVFRLEIAVGDFHCNRLARHERSCKQVSVLLVEVMQRPPWTFERYSPEFGKERIDQLVQLVGVLQNSGTWFTLQGAKRWSGSKKCLTSTTYAFYDSHGDTTEH